MSLTEIIFLLVASVCLGSAVALAFSRSLIRAAFWLFAVLLSTGGLFAFVGADVLTVSQIVVYVGGILILIVFGVMLTSSSGNSGPATRLTKVFPALGILLVIGAGLFQMISEYPASPPSWQQLPEVPLSNVSAIGLETMTHWLIPFEVVSVLLLIALVGAAYLARPDQKKAPHDGGDSGIAN